MDFPAPTFDKIIPIGGISVKTQKKSLELPEKWNKILGLRKKNILVSFGSNARSADMPEHFKWVFLKLEKLFESINFRQNVLKVAESMPDVTFIWKYENEKDTLADHLDNVYLGDWLPQNELLGE